MKVIWITLTVGLLTITAVLAQDNEEYDYDEDVVVAPQPAQRGRAPLLSSRQSKAIPLTSNNKIKAANGKATKQSAAKAPQVQDEQDEYQDEYDQGAEEPVEVTSTEAPKKTIKPVVRPFRSNDDLLAALKRRRQQVQNTGGVVDKTTSTTTTTTTSSPNGTHKKGSSSFNSGRRGRVPPSPRGQATQATETIAAEVEPTKKSPQSRRYNSRSNGRAAPQQQTQPNVEEDRTLEDVPQQPAAKPKFGRGSRRPA